jgi:hypothetical protein
VREEKIEYEYEKEEEMGSFLDHVVEGKFYEP